MDIVWGRWLLYRVCWLLHLHFFSTIEQTALERFGRVEKNFLCHQSLLVLQHFLS
jgi:hypothetical protein